MKLKDINSGLNAINSVTDFIDSNTDSDETGIGTEMMDLLNKLSRDLMAERNKIFYKNALQSAKRKYKLSK